MRTGNPNPAAGYLAARSYAYPISAMAVAGPWSNVVNASGPIMLMDAQSQLVPFNDLAQCAYLNYTIGYYLNGGQ